MPARLSRSTVSLLVARAALMRADMPAEERALWRCLCAGQLGVVFRRQVPVLEARCIADFAAPAARWVVELDGAHHRDRRAADRRRDERLRRAGWRVLRIEAELVRRDLPEALRRVREALGEGSPGALG